MKSLEAVALMQADWIPGSLGGSELHGDEAAQPPSPGATGDDVPARAYLKPERLPDDLIKALVDRDLEEAGIPVAAIPPPVLDGLSRVDGDPELPAVAVLATGEPFPPDGDGVVDADDIGAVAEEEDSPACSLSPIPCDGDRLPPVPPHAREVTTPPGMVMVEAGELEILRREVDRLRQELEHARGALAEMDALGIQVAQLQSQLCTLGNRQPNPVPPHEEEGGATAVASDPPKALVGESAPSERGHTPDAANVAGDDGTRSADSQTGGDTESPALQEGAVHGAAVAALAEPRADTGPVEDGHSPALVHHQAPLEEADLDGDVTPTSQADAPPVMVQVSQLPESPCEPRGAEPSVVVRKELPARSRRSSRKKDPAPFASLLAEAGGLKGSGRA